MSSPGSAGSPLDRIEAAAQTSEALSARRSGLPDRTWRDDVLALVNVAKAAERLMAEMVPADEYHTWPGENELREALAVLSRPEPTDKEPA